MALHDLSPPGASPLVITHQPPISKGLGRTKLARIYFKTSEANSRQNIYFRTNKIVKLGIKRIVLNAEHTTEFIGFPIRIQLCK